MTLPEQRPGSSPEARDQMLELLAAHYEATQSCRRALSSEEPLLSLLADCRHYLEQQETAPAAPIRTIDHLACTGGTLISKGLQAQPNALVLSEVDPFNGMPRGQKKTAFAPSDVIRLARSGLYDLDNATIAAMFVGALRPLHARLDRRGRDLILRVHSHSQFCTGLPWDSRPLVRAVIGEHFRTLSVVTVRHPLDSWLALNHNGWAHFRPSTLEEYSRRYLTFLEAHAGVSRLKYEGFVADPDASMRWLCAQLELGFNPDWQYLISVTKLSGDSGRSASKIGSRARRDIPDATRHEMQSSVSYARLCQVLGYEAASDGLQPHEG